MMRLFSVSLFLFSTLHASWDFDIFAKGSELYDETREKTIQIYKDTLETLTPETHETPKENREVYLETAWENVVDDLKKGTAYIDQKRHLPDTAWIGRDQKDVQEDFNKLFERIIQGLVGQRVEEDQNAIAALKHKIDENRQMILLYREKRIGAPQSSLLHTTKSEYDKKIEALKEENRIWQNDIRIHKERLQKRFADIGVKLSLEQVDVLLARVDGNDIIRMAMVMDTLKYITQQIENLMKQSSEALQEAKRYYGMHQVLLELVVYLQKEYIDRCNREYIPKVQSIIRQAEGMITHTESLRRQEEDGRRAAVYARNIDALKLTLKAAKQYEADLVASRDRMKEAQKVALANLVLSKNTYETVSLSSDLYTLISESQEMFMTVSRIQVPQIVPFDNLQLKRKYQEITQKLK
jgi:predicted nucleic-acid-binding protein